MKQRLFVTLGVSAALLAGIASMASAEPRGTVSHPAERTGGISIILQLPIFGRTVHQVRPVEHDYRWQEQQRLAREQEMRRERVLQRERDSRYGHNHYNERDQHDHDYRGH